MIRLRASLDLDDYFADSDDATVDQLQFCYVSELSLSPFQATMQMMNCPLVDAGMKIAEHEEICLVATSFPVCW